MTGLGVLLTLYNVCVSWQLEYVPDAVHHMSLHT